ncbi:MAG: SHOCT domain-containing protein [Ruminococcus sp.]|nr:SHOCT domain-containing protein [Ruminococcus sp.]
MKKMLYNYTNHTIINFLFGRKFMADLKNSWKNTGAGLGHAFRDLGKTIIVSGKEGVDKAVDWAESDPNANTAQQGYVPQGAPYVPQGAPIPQPQPVQQAKSQNFTADEIRKLAQLRDEGLITDEEFTAKKKQLLGI